MTNNAMNADGNSATLHSRRLWRGLAVILDQHMALIRIVAICLMLFMIGCTSYDKKNYEGKVVDEEGKPIEGASVLLCYTGWDWDWSMAGGVPLVMGQPFCSEPVVTDELGKYKVVFAGPPSTTILARRRGWIQTKSVLADSGRVVLVARMFITNALQTITTKKKEFFGNENKMNLIPTIIVV